jgi:hypothetical protein
VPAWVPPRSTIEDGNAYLISARSFASARRVRLRADDFLEALPRQIGIDPHGKMPSAESDAAAENFGTLLDRNNSSERRPGLALM